jgi:hypothetical protein
VNLVLACLDRKLEQACDLGARRVQANCDDFAARNRLQLNCGRLKWGRVGGHRERMECFGVFTLYICVIGAVHLPCLSRDRVDSTRYRKS